MKAVPGEAEKLSIRLEEIPSEPDSSVTLRRFVQSSFPFNWHYHPEAELTFIIHGRGLRFVGDSIENYRDGDVCLLGSNLPHSWQSPANGSAVSSIVVQFDESVIGGAFPQIPEAQTIRKLLHERSRRGLIVRGRTARAVSESMEEMAEEKKGSMRRVILLLDSLQRIAEADVDVQPISTTQMRIGDIPEHAGKLSLVLDRLEASLGDVLPRQSDMAELLNLTPAAFSRLFKRVIGKTYIDFLNDWRIGIACRRLLESDDPIIDVALAAGFENLSNFHRRFMAVKGLTPGQFRSLSRKQIA